MVGTNESWFFGLVLLETSLFLLLLLPPPVIWEITSWEQIKIIRSLPEALGHEGHVVKNIVRISLGIFKEIRDMGTDFKYMIDILEYVELFKFHDNTRTYQY